MISMFYVILGILGSIVTSLFVIAAAPGLDRYSEDRRKRFEAIQKEEDRMLTNLNKEHDRKLTEIYSLGKGYNDRRKMINELNDEYDRERDRIIKEYDDKMDQHIASRSIFGWKSKD